MASGAAAGEEVEDEVVFITSTKFDYSIK